MKIENVARLVADAAPVLHVDADGFDARLMRAIRARVSAPPAEPLPFPYRPALRPLALAAALFLMVISGAISLMLSVPAAVPSGAGSTQARILADDASDLEDSISSPREIPFTVEGDLVGARRGTIPLTTYVLEPPPEQADVVRASL